MKRMTLATILGVILMSSIGLAALLTSYGVITGTANVNQSVLVDGEQTPESLSLEYTITGTGGNTYYDEWHTLLDQADIPAPIDIQTTNDEGITTTYYGKTILTEKTVDFGADIWDIPENAEQVGIQYTIVSGEFDAWVTDNEQEGYVIIYYFDNPDRYTYPGEAIKVEDVMGYLPYHDDANRFYHNYCTTGEYLTCFGAKLWYVPLDAINEDDSLVWSRASEFFYETELIQWQPSGEITLYPQYTLNFGIKNVFDIALAPGEYTIITNIAVGN